MAEFAGMDLGERVQHVRAGQGGNQVDQSGLVSIPEPLAVRSLKSVLDPTYWSGTQVTGRFFE